MRMVNGDGVEKKFTLDTENADWSEAMYLIYLYPEVFPIVSESDSEYPYIKQLLIDEFINHNYESN